MKSDVMAMCSIGIYLFVDLILWREFGVSNAAGAYICCLLVGAFSEIHPRSFDGRQVGLALGTAAMLFAGGNVGNMTISPHIPDKPKVVSEADASEWINQQRSTPTPRTIPPWIGSSG